MRVSCVLTLFVAIVATLAYADLKEAEPGSRIIKCYKKDKSKYINPKLPVYKLLSFKIFPYKCNLGTFFSKKELYKF